jgi:hypothetical protein
VAISLLQPKPQASIQLGLHRVQRLLNLQPRRVCLSSRQSPSRISPWGIRCMRISPRGVDLALPLSALIRAHPQRGPPPYPRIFCRAQMGHFRKSHDDPRASHDSCPREVSRYSTQQFNRRSSSIDAAVQSTQQFNRRSSSIDAAVQSTQQSQLSCDTREMSCDFKKPSNGASSGKRA